MESLIIKPHYLEPWNIELYDYRKWDKWTIDNWTLSIYASIVYVICVFVGRKWMEQRKPFQLRVPLIIWNTFLAIGSAIAFSRLYPELLNELQVYGVKHSICNRSVL
jgi:elongation of very long chain fatty acids protein 6